MANKKATDLEQGEQASLLPSPPPYTALPAASSSSHVQPTNTPPVTRQSQYPQGPSPFASLPLPQTSLYAHERQLRQSDRRARRRFCAAMCWALVIYMAMGLLSGAVVGYAVTSGAPRDDGRTGHGHGHRRGDWMIQQEVSYDSSERILHRSMLILISATIRDYAQTNADSHTDSAFAST
ncbi:uncharacterized protein JCM15063_001849 [Sporobolomyces koalae]|uniref:uncharacterized protein n=1 Tax=Sporobolomyces koalae TaxID=500713 RepID=UPI003179CB3D